MLNKKQIFVTIILLSIVVFTIWLIISANKISIHPNLPDKPDAFATDIKSVKLNKLGEIDRILISPKIVHYPKNNMSKITKPFAIINKKDEQPWHITSDRGEALEGTKKIILFGNVKIRQLPGENSKNITLLTTEITFYPDRSYIETDKPVTIKQPGNIVKAIGLQADLNTGYIKLLSKVKGQYSGDI